MSHTEAEIGLPFCKACQCWGLHDCAKMVTIVTNGFLFCNDCQHYFHTHTHFLEHPCVQQCRYSAAKLDEDNGWWHYCPYRYEHQNLEIMEMDEQLPSHDGFFIDRELMFGYHSQTYAITAREPYPGIKTFVRDTEPHVPQIIINEANHHDIRAFAGVVICFEKEDTEEGGEVIVSEEQLEQPVQPGGVNTINFDTWWNEFCQWIMKEIDAYIKKGRGWRVRHVLRMGIALSVPPVLRTDDIFKFEKENNIVRCYVHSMKGFKGPLYPNRKDKEEGRLVVHLLLTDIDVPQLKGHYLPISDITMMAHHYYQNRFDHQPKRPCLLDLLS